VSRHIAHANKVLSIPVIIVKMPIIRLILVSVDRLGDGSPDEAVVSRISKAVAEKIGGDSPITHPSQSQGQGLKGLID